jgi:hypothetical protein
MLILPTSDLSDATSEWTASSKADLGLPHLQGCPPGAAHESVEPAIAASPGSSTTISLSQPVQTVWRKKLGVQEAKREKRRAAGARGPAGGISTETQGTSPSKE